jgi:hypothetical protein
MQKTYFALSVPTEPEGKRETAGLGRGPRSGGGRLNQWIPWNPSLMKGFQDAAFQENITITYTDPVRMIRGILVLSENQCLAEYARIRSNNNNNNNKV